MKHVFFALMVVVSLLTGAAKAQIPVTVTSDVPATANHIEEMIKWGEQLTRMKAQLTQLESTYKSLNGIRGMGALFNDPAARKYLPAEWQEVYSNLDSGKLSGITGSVSAIRSAYSRFDSKDLSTDTQGRALFDKQLNDAAVAKAFSEAYRQAGARLSNLQGLLDRVDTATDQKDVLDLQARIQAEHVMLQNEQIKLSLVQQLAQAEGELRKAQARDLRVRSAGGTSPLSFTK